MKECESTRLLIRELEAEDLEKVLPVYLSNPELVRRMEGSEGEAGRYDLERWQRDWQIAQMMPGRHTLWCELKENGAAIGYLDYLEEGEDGYPLLGQVLIHGDYQRRGLGSEAFLRLIDYLRAQYSWSTLRAWALEENTVGKAFLHHLGFHELGQEPGRWRLPGGPHQYTILEYGLPR